MSRTRDILDELTKDELLAWVRTQFFRMPKRSNILYLRWEKQSGDLLREYKAQAKGLDGVDLAERDRLAVAFNASTSATERLRLIELMEPYDKAIAAHSKRYRTLDARQKKVDRLYEQIDIERQKEVSR